MKRINNSIAFWGLAIPPIITLVLYGYLGTYTRLLADDFCSVYYANRLGLLKSIWFWRLNWSGRYSAFGADWVLEKIGTRILPVVPPLLIFIWLALTAVAIYLWLRRTFPEETKKPIALSLSINYLFAVLVINPNIPQVLYWWNGMRSYTLPLIILTGYIILFQLGTGREQNRNRIFAGSLISFLSMFVIGGLGETYVVFQGTLLMFLLALEWLVYKDIKSTRFFYLLAGIIGSVLSTIIVASAPGNAIRQAFFPPHPNVFELFHISINGFIDFIILIVQTPEKIAALVSSVLVSVWLGLHSRRKEPENRIIHFATFLGSFILPFVCIVPDAYATSEPPPSRTWIIPIFIGMACAMYTGFLTGEKIKSKGYQTTFVTNSVLVISFFLISYSALITSQQSFNNRSVYIDFAQLWDSTDAQILKARAAGQKSVNIPAMDNWAGLERPTPKEDYWPNRCYSAYYDIQVYGPSYE